MKKSCDKTVEPFCEKASPKTAKEWAWFFYQELGYRLVEDEEQEVALKNAMDKVLRKDRESFTKKLQIWIRDFEEENERILKVVNEDQQLTDAQVQAILKISYFNNGYLAALKDAQRAFLSAGSCDKKVQASPKTEAQKP